MSQSQPIADWLQAWRGGDMAARDRLFAFVYDDLRAMARRHMQGENAGHTLQATALVNEAYERLLGVQVDWRDRAHFVAMVAQVMRRILVDHARGRAAAKRGGNAGHVGLDDITDIPSFDNPMLLDLDEAISSLGGHDPRKEQVLELHYFGGLTLPQIAAALDVSTATVERDLRMGRAWLKRALNDGHAASNDQGPGVADA